MNFLRFGLSRVVSLTLVFLLASNQTLATPPVSLAFADLLRGQQQSLAFLWHSSGLSKLWQGQNTPTPQPQETQPQRDAKVVRLKIFPENATTSAGYPLVMTALALDSKGDSIGGVKFTWSSVQENGPKSGFMSQRGEFNAPYAGVYVVRAEGAGKQAQTKVTVVGQARPRPQNLGQGIPVSSRDLPVKTSFTAPSPQSSDKQVSAKQKIERNAFRASANGFSLAAKLMTAPLLLPEYGWDDTNYMTADDPGQDRGDPPGRPIDDGAGNSNFQFSAPVMGLNGRGMDVSLSLNYNSRLWHKAGSDITFDIDRDWPAPGWSLGFGKIARMGNTHGYMVVGADGTRHSFAGNLYYGSASGGLYFIGNTTDGTFIDYSVDTLSDGTPTYATAKLPNGTVIKYGAWGDGALYPTQIIDASGNYTSITYPTDAQGYSRGPRIQTITDTMGRAIQFHYDGSNLLTAITATGINSTSRTLVRLHYRSLTLGYSFTGVTPRVRQATVPVIDAIYYPGTNTGYWFGDADSYSGYGMLTKVIEQRGMQFSASSLNDQGTVTPGTESQRMVYAFNTGGGLTDAPGYTSMTETWAGMDDTAAVTSYLVQTSANPRRIEITRPDGTRIVQLSHNAPGQFNDGQIYQDETYGPNGALLSRSFVNWEQGTYQSPRPTRTEITDERGQVTGTELTYGPYYNQVTEAREYDYGYAFGGANSLLRRTATQYENGSGYTGSHVFNLTKSVEVYGSDGIRASRTEYFYDQYSLTDAPGIVRLDETYNPYSPPREVCGCVFVNDFCEWTCNYESVYVQSTAFRGNLTQVKSYSNAANLTGAIIENRYYDIAGNLIRANMDCCEQTTLQFTSSTQYAYPQSQTRGSATDATARVNSSAVFDFYTGLVTSGTDANGRTGSTIYDAATWRPLIDYSPTGARTEHYYDDANLLIIDSTYGADGVLAARGDKYLDGEGRVKGEIAYGAGYVNDVVDTKYDRLGRVKEQTRPYRNGSETPRWYTVAYDELGRTKIVIAPDGSVSERFYGNAAGTPNAASSLPGQLMRVRDQWARERWARTDALGRLVEVVEPNASGDGTVTTNGYRTEYQYDVLNRLTLVTQGTQQRSFKYDSLSRLTHQKLAERDATLNDSGQIGSGQWSDYFVYDNRSNMISHTDARGVLTSYNYNNDPLNRLKTVSYAAPAGSNIPAAAGVSYDYMPGGDVTRLWKVTDGMGVEEFHYDIEGRLDQKTRTFTARTGQPLVTSYEYDTLDRVKKVIYPARYGNNGLRQEVVPEYDIASRMSGLKLDGSYIASQFVYNAASQTESLLLGNGVTENYNYDSQTGLLTNQQVSKGVTKHLDLSYGYTRAGSAAKTGQLTQITDNLTGNNGNRNRSFQYDPLGRLKLASGTRSGVVWSQEYRYDRYGNREQVIASGSLTSLAEPPSFSVPMPQPPQSKIKDQVAFNAINAPARWGNVSSPNTNKKASVERSVTDANIGGPRRSDTAKLKTTNADANTAADASPQINRPPACVIGGPYSGTAGSSISFNGSASYDPDGSIVSYIWNFGDNTAGSGAILGHTYSAPGTYTVSLTVRDNRSASRTCSTTATVTGGGNQSPTARPGGPYSGTVGTAISFNGSTSSDPDGTITAYNWNFGDGTTATGATPSKSYSVAGTFTVLLTVTDNQGATHSASTTATITSGTTPPNYEGYFDGADCNTLWGWAADRNRLNTSINVDIYDGATLILANVPANQSRPDVGSYLGDNGLHGFGIATPASLKNGQPHSLTVKFAGTTQTLTSSPRSITCMTNQSPTARPGGPYSGTVGTAISFSGSTSSDPDGTITAYSWNFGDGTTATGATPSKSYSAAGTFTVTLTVTDNQGATHSASTTATISNPPTGALTDGAPNLTYNQTNNRISTAGYSYDSAGNLLRGQNDGVTWQNYQYDAANRLVTVTNDIGGVLARNYYGADNRRLKVEENGIRWFAWDGGDVVTEYGDTGSAMTWQLNRVYLGGRLLAEVKAAGIEYHHPDRLGTRLVTDAVGNKLSEQATLPYGTSLASETSGAEIKRRFTSYERGSATKLDYALNRHYSSWQGRFTQVDPIGMQASSLSDPQSLNLYSYVGNDPINRTDSDGLFWGKLFSALGKAFKWVARVGAVILAVVGVLVLTVWSGNPFIAIAAWKLLVGAGALALVGWGKGVWAKLGSGIIGGLGPLGKTPSFRTPPINGSAGVGAITIFINRFQDRADTIVMDTEPAYSSYWEYLKAIAKRINYVKAGVGAINVLLGGRDIIRGVPGLIATIPIAVAGVAAAPESGGVSLVLILPAAISAKAAIGGPFRFRRGIKQLGEAWDAPSRGEWQNVLGLLSFGDKFDDPGELGNSFSRIRRLPWWQKIGESLSW